MKLKTDEVLALMLNRFESKIKTRRRIKRPKLKLPDFDEEIMCLMLSDFQIGLKTATYNIQVFEKRMKQYIKNLRIILRKERRTIPIRKCVVFLLGDILHNDLVGKFITLEEFETCVIQQWEEVALPNLEMLIADLLNIFEKVEIYAVAGNHGKYNKISERNNFDAFTYKTLKLLFRKQDRLKFQIAEHFNMLVDIWGWKFHLCHGDQIPLYSGIPYFAMIRRALNWANSLGGFDYQLFGHFHHCVYFTISNLAVLINGSFVSDCEYTMKKLGVNPPPRQWVFGLHPRYGMTWRYEVRLDKERG